MKDEPLVMCVTNMVAANFTANVLLAIGAKPSMIQMPDEAEELAAIADATLVNLGTVDEQQVAVMRAGIRSANAHGKPWVLDPVAVQALSFRRQMARAFLAEKPALVRGNHAEIAALHLSGVTTLATGEIDVITRADGTRREIDGGVPMLQTVTATGCAQGAICAAMLGKGMTPFDAALAASTLMKRAGEQAWTNARTPGCFQLALIDALWEVTHK